jgi:aryl-alcohol dehydrogenase-like predicted oxidoreductase
MKYKNLGSSDLNVSRVCLGTMMMGSQTDLDLSLQIINEAWDRGVNFLDTAEMYSIPPTPETQGNSERYIGEWLKQRGKRDDVIIATKVTGRSNLVWVRGKGNTADTILDKTNITHAIENSLERLNTDYIDLYQLHWPDRDVAKFGFEVEEAAIDDPNSISIEETLEVLADLVKSGKVRYIGVSNETLNGVREFTRLAREKGLPMIVSIQNVYSLVSRCFDGELAEFCMENNIGLLPYSILAMGILTGKYLDGVIPPGSREALFQNLERYDDIKDGALVKRYREIADNAGITLNELAHAFVHNRPFVDSTIIGATSLEQLHQDLHACTLTLDDSTLQAIEALHLENPNPCP